MSQAALCLDKPIVSAELLEGSAMSDAGPSSAHESAESAARTRSPAHSDTEARKAAFPQVCQALNGVIARLNESYAGIFREHREEIARLSVEIARKILTQKVDKGDYEIESIVKEALGHSPSRHDVVVHLNPDDLTQCRKAQHDDERGGALTGIEFVADPNIGRAECLIESPKGIIKSLIDEHLERIGKALRKAE
jgi:flagellar biosynthesis/type III secretory pathway protein FliH